MGARKPNPAEAASPDAATIVRALREAYDGPAWHGPSVRVALRGLSAERAAVRPAPERNTIWELVLHLAYARHGLLLRVKRFHDIELPAFPRKLQKPWFPELPPTLDERAWKRDRALLGAYQERLVGVLESVPPQALRKRRPGRRRSIGMELLGLALHDAYHAGQIRLLDRLGA